MSRGDGNLERKAKVTIGIKGGFGQGNFGDDALMLAIYHVVKEIPCSKKIVFICRNADYIQRIIPGATVFSPGAFDANRVNISVYGGGTQFYSFPLTSNPSFFSRVANNAKHPFGIGKKVLRKLTKMKEPSFKTGSNVAAIGIGIGPFVANSKAMRETKELFSRMDYIAVRDYGSSDLCKEWGLQNAALRADLCYLPGIWHENTCVSHTGATRTGIQRIGVIPRDWPHTIEGQAYRKHLFQVVDELRLSGKEVEFLILSEPSDRKWIDHLVAKGEQPKIWNPEQSTILDYVELLSSYDAFLSARYHGAVFASLLGKPVVCIEVEQKLRLVSVLLEGGARLWEYPFTVSECLRQFQEIEFEYGSTVNSLERVVEHQSVLAAQMANEFKEFISDLILNPT